MGRTAMLARACFAVVIAASIPLSVRADDKAEAWVDALPTVSQVAAVAREMSLERLRAQRGPAGRIDGDLLAADIVGGLRLMRWVAELQHARGAAPVTPARVTRLRELTASYLQAELMIGSANGRRQGFLTTVRRCNVQQRDPSYAGTGGAECYRFWFGVLLRSTTPSGGFRNDMLTKLFRCNEPLGRELDALVQQHIRVSAGRWKVPDTPAEALRLPAGVGAVRASPCDAAGGDADGNGLCATWEQPHDTVEMQAAGGPIWCPCPEPAVSRPVAAWPRGTNFDAVVIGTGERKSAARPAKECGYGVACFQQKEVQFEIRKTGHLPQRYTGLEYVPGTLHRRSNAGLQCHELDPRFNCHGLSLARGQYWLGDDTAAKILHHWCSAFPASLPGVDTRSGDLRVYRAAKVDVMQFPPSHSETLQADPREVDRKLGVVKYGHMPKGLVMEKESWYEDPQFYYRCRF